MNPTYETLNKANLNAPFREPITEEIFSYINLVFNMIVNPTLALAAILSNTINMVVFYKMGLSEGVTQNFFILALSDGLLASIAFINKLLLILRTAIIAYIGYGSLEQVVHILYQASFFSIPFPQNYSLITTVVIAVVQCCCVAMPLKVKYLLTVKRQLAAILFLSGIATSVFAYVLAPMSIIYIPYPAANTTIAYFRGARWPTYTVFNTVASFGAFTICITSVLILSASLSKASKFRDDSTKLTSSSGNNDKTPSRDTKSKERQRSTRAVRTVLLISVVFIVRNVPNMVFFVLKITLEGFENGNIFQFANLTTVIVAEMFLLMSSSLNTSIYIFYNSRYRTILLTIFGERPEVAHVGFLLR